MCDIRCDNLLKNRYDYILQGYHFKCKLCKRYPKYSKTKYDVRRHLQEQHSGVGFQCAFCGLTFNRRSLRHGCNATEKDMEYTIRSTGDFGDVAKAMLLTFIQGQDKHWEYVTVDDYEEGLKAAKATTDIRSVVVVPHPPIAPMPREETMSPEMMEEPEISLEEPPRKIQRLHVDSRDQVAEDLVISPTLSTASSLSASSSSSSSGSSSSGSSSDTESEEDLNYECDDDNVESENPIKHDERTEKVNEKQKEKTKVNENLKKTENRGKEMSQEYDRKRTDKEKEKQKETSDVNEKLKGIEKDRKEKSKENKNKRDSSSSSQRKEKQKEKSKENEIVKESTSDKQGKEKEKTVENNKGKEVERKTHDNEKVKDSGSSKQGKEKEKAVENNKGKAVERKTHDNEKVRDSASNNQGKEKQREMARKVEKEVHNIMKESISTTKKAEGIEKKKETESNISEKTKQKHKGSDANKENKPSKDSENKEKGRKQNEKQNEPIKGVEKGKGSSITTKAKVCTLNEKKDKQNCREESVKESGKEKDLGGEQRDNNKLKSVKERQNKEKQIMNDKSSDKKGRNLELVRETSENDLEVGSILQTMTETFSFMQMRPITPIDNENEGLESCRCVRADEDENETIRAVESIEKEMENSNERESESVMADAALEVLELNIINSEIDGIINHAIEEVISRRNKEEENIEEIIKTNTGKRKRDVLEDKEDRHTTKRANRDTETEEDMYCEDRDLAMLKEIQNSRVILNVGGARFETSRPTLRNDPNSLFAKIFTTESSVVAQGNTIFFDRDPSHFKIILNYLRYNLEINPAVLPKERKYLVELKKECEYYRIQGLCKIIENRLAELWKY